MEVDKREIKLKRHKDSTTKMILKNKNNNKALRQFSGGVGVSKFFLPEKRKLIPNIFYFCDNFIVLICIGARKKRKKFLFGGSITDPLNLNSLQVRSFEFSLQASVKIKL